MPRLAYVFVQLIALTVALCMMYTIQPLSWDENADWLRCVEASGQGSGEEVSFDIGGKLAGALEDKAAGLVGLEDEEEEDEEDAPKPGTACFGASAILRMTFTLFVFHLIMLISLVSFKYCCPFFN